MRRGHRLRPRATRLQHDPPSTVGIRDTAGQTQPRNLGNTCQRLTAKAETDNGLQPGGGGELAGGVRGNGQTQLLPGDTGTVIGDANGPDSTLLHHDMQGLRPGVQTVFHQFLDDRCGALDDFPGGDPADQRGIEYLNAHAVTQSIARHSRRPALLRGRIRTSRANAT